ncbi:MAG: ShlB/FhaC/HecB family hemolysin secretion/activation protein [Ramlibacter sp.]|nr:ShlB/FhaC/HecB family hemolysin secretion/activation protein [Ramlibacter sp.]
MALLAAATGAWAQSPALPAMTKPAPAPVFAIRGFQVTGDNPLGDGETSRVLAPFLRSDATMEVLQKATTALEAALRDKGFGLHRVALPPQEVGDTVTLNIVKFTVAKVNIEGREIYDEGNVLRALPELKPGESPNFKTLAIQTAIANENPNKQYQVGLRESDEPDKIEATITVKESRPWTFAAGISNSGTEASGRDRLVVSGGHTNLFNLDHQFVGAYTTSVERTSDVKQFGLSYRIPLYAWGGVIGASYTHSDVVGNFGTFTSTGAGHTAGASYTWYLAPEGGRRSFVTLALDDKVFDASDVSGVLIGVDRRSRPVTLGYAARVESDTSLIGYNLDLAVNTGSGRSNDLASYQSEDPRVDTVKWKAVRGAISYSAPLAETWLFSARTNFQYSPDPLISGEQFGLGGLGSVRGTTIDRPITGDSGIFGSVEVTTPELGKGLRLLGFVDAGWLGNNTGLGLGDKVSHDHLASAGLGLRWTWEPVFLTIDYGRLLNSSRLSPLVNSASPQRGDDRFYVNLSVRF